MIMRSMQQYALDVHSHSPKMVLMSVYLYLCVCFSLGVGCPSGWDRNPYHNSCIKKFNTRLGFVQARQECATHNSTVVHVDSVEMLDLIGDLIGPISNIWVSTNDLLEEGVYRGVGGQLMAYIPWKQGQPNDATQDEPRTQNCVEMEQTYMEDKPCEKPFQFVCELWPNDLQTAQFVKMSMEFLQVSNLGFDQDNFFRLTTDRKMTCAKECRKLRHVCDAFVFSTSAKDCYSLRLFDTDDPKVLTVSQRNDIYMTRASVHVMHG